MIAIMEGTTYGSAYKNATDTSSGGWAVTDKLFGYLDRAGEIYNDIRYPQPDDEGYDASVAEQRRLNAGMFGLQKPWDGVVLIVGVALIGFGIYKIAAD